MLDVGEASGLGRESLRMLFASRPLHPLRWILACVAVIAPDIRDVCQRKGEV
jgi:hypothetical protein